MLNIIYKEGNNNNNKSYIIFPDLDLGSDNCISERTNNESLELRKLKLLVTGFISKSYVNSYKSFDGKIKQILEIFIENIKLVDKVIENKNIYYNNDIKKNIFKNYYKDISFKITEDCKNKISKRLF